MLRPVLLFKEPTSDTSYETILQDHGYQAKSIPVLQTTLVNADRLLEHLVNAQELGLQGTIITSKRSCDSLTKAFSNLCSNNSEDGARIPALAYWSTVPFYVVGEATATAIRQIQVRFQQYGLTSVQILGESSGTGEQLGRLIASQYQHVPGGKLLYLTGDKNRDTVASILSQNQIPFQLLQVYETTQRPDFEQLLEQAVVDLLHTGVTEGPWWTVYFAPSTAKFAIPAARQLLESRNISSRLATIGPVTTSFIEKTLSQIVEATASEPNATALAGVIMAYDEDNMKSDVFL